MIYEYLKQRGAYGRGRAVPGREIRRDLNCTSRRFDRILYDERKAGRLICNYSSAGGGYYLPASVEEVKGFVIAQESRIKKHAVTLRAARAYLKAHGAAKASSH